MLHCATLLSEPMVNAHTRGSAGSVFHMWLNEVSANKRERYTRNIFSHWPRPGLAIHDDGIKWKHFPRYWPFIRGIHRSPVNSPH